MKTKKMIYLKKYFFLFFIPCTLILLFTSLSSQGINNETQKYATLNQCAECHEDLVIAFKDSIHGKKGFRQLSDKACIVCHGPGKEHIDNGGDTSKIRSFKKISNNEKTKVCLQCHEKEKIMFWQGSRHESQNMVCQSCHSIHSPRSKKSLLSKTRETDLCFSCHQQRRSQSLRSSHHPIKEGKVVCSDCHNPHGALESKLISSDSINKKCFECHAEKRGPFLWEHEPVSEECTICHDPHGSNHPSLLIAKMPFLCQRCHSEPTHPGNLYDSSKIKSNKLFNRSCSNCHSRIHGSNHPSGHTFLR